MEVFRASGLNGFRTSGFRAFWRGLQGLLGFGVFGLNQHGNAMETTGSACS